MRAPSKHSPTDAGIHVLPFTYMPVGAVCAAIGFSVSSLYALIKQGEFPCGDLIGQQSRRWKSTDIAAWLVEQSEKSAQRESAMAAPLKRKAEAAARKSAASRAAAKEADHATA